MEPLASISIIVIVTLLLLLLARLRRTGRAVNLRPLPGFTALEGQVGRAIESGSRLHITLGRASLASLFSPSSIAALTVLDRMAKEGGANGTPPLVTVGEGTLLPAAQDSLRAAYSQIDRTSEFEPGVAQFIASDLNPFAYAGGVTAVIQQNRVSSSAMVGHFGSEVAVMATAASRQGIDQIVGTDDPVALALAWPLTDNLLIGEELLAAGAYLEGNPAQVASLQAQDILRLLVILVILGMAVYQLVTSLQP